MVIKIQIELIPPSVNNYVRHTKDGIHFKTSAAKNFQQLVALRSGEHRGKLIEAKEVSILVCLGKGQSGDVDNFPKLVLDGLVRAKVIRSDASITRLVVDKCRAGLLSLPSTTVWIKD